MFHIKPTKSIISTDLVIKAMFYRTLKIKFFWPWRCCLCIVSRTYIAPFNNEKRPSFPLFLKLDFIHVAFILAFAPRSGISVSFSKDMIVLQVEVPAIQVQKYRLSERVN